MQNQHTRELISARETSHKHNNNDKCAEDVPLVEFIYLVFTRMPGESYRKQLLSLLFCLCDIFQALINSLVCSSWWFHIPGDQHSVLQPFAGQSM